MKSVLVFLLLGGILFVLPQQVFAQMTSPAAEQIMDHIEIYSHSISK